MSFELPADTNFWLAVAVILGTSLLTFISALYILETRRLRREADKARLASQQPIFTLEPSQFHMSMRGPLGGEFMRINLVNHGQPATDIFARCTWRENETSEASSQEFYIVSLAKGGYAGLDIPVNEIVNKQHLLTVEIECKDAFGNAYATTVTNSFNKIRGTTTQIAYQNNYAQAQRDAFDRIVYRLGDIEGKIDRL
jgi:hypothetical protein